MPRAVTTTVRCANIVLDISGVATTMNHSQGVPAEFVHRFESLKSRKSISRDEFLNLAAAAISVYHQDQTTRHHLAWLVSNLWVAHDEIAADAEIDQIGDAFSKLELPDGHVLLKNGETIKSKWIELASMVARARAAEG